jgi:hypothetical protein
MRDVLVMSGYAEGVDLRYVWTQGADHSEAAWAARVHEPLEQFAAMP